MSTIYSYYLGYRTTDDKLHAFGPYDKYGTMIPLFERSQSWSYINKLFKKVNIEEMDEDLYDKFTFKFNGIDDEVIQTNLFFLPVSNLPKDTDYMKLNYYPTREVINYSQNNDYEFTDMYTMEEYSIKLKNAVEHNDEETIRDLRDYTLFAYPDTDCIEYETYMLLKSIESYPFDYYSVKDDIKFREEDLKELVFLMEMC